MQCSVISVDSPAAVRLLVSHINSLITHSFIALGSCSIQAEAKM